LEKSCQVSVKLYPVSVKPYPASAKLFRASGKPCFLSSVLRCRD
jgi:hypothetical protein